MKSKIESLLLTLFLTGTLAFTFNAETIKTEYTTMFEPFQLKTYLQGYTPNKIILYDLLDHADEAEWYAQPREEQIPFGEDLGDEGAVRYEYNVTLEDGKTYDRTVMVRPNINLTPQNWSDIEGRWYFELPNVTPLYLKAEWGFAPDANSDTEVNVFIAGMPADLPQISWYGGIKPSDHLHGFLVDLSDLIDQFKGVTLYAYRESDSTISPSYWTNAFIFTIEGEDYNVGQGTRWFEYPQTYGSWFDLFWNLGDRFDPTVDYWGVSADIDDPHSFEGRFNAYSLLGCESFPAGNFREGNTEEDRNQDLYLFHPELRNATITNIYRQPVELIQWWGEIFRPMDCNNPFWQDYIKNQMLTSIDLGAEGNFFDELSGNTGWIANPNETSFDSPSMEGFKTWLAEHYTQEEFDQTIGEHIPIEDFDYRLYLIEKGFDDGYLNRREWTPNKNQNSVPLSHDYDLYTIEAGADFLREVVSEARAYAASLGQEYVFSGNVADPYALSRIAMFTSGALDLYHLEKPALWSAPWQSRKGALSPVDGRLIITMLLSKDIGLQYNEKDVLVVACPSATSEELYLYTREYDEDSTMPKILFAQAYASQGSIIWYKGMPNEIQPNIPEIGEYARFILSDSLVFEKTKSNHRIGVLYTQTSMTGRSGLFTGSFDYPFEGNYDFRDSFWGACSMLLDSHNQFDVIFTGDDLLVDDALSLADLEKCEIVILPNAFCLTDNQVSVILDYVGNGGIVVAFGETGTSNENNEETSRPDLESLTVLGTHDYGNGKFVYLGGSEKDNIGIDYFVDRSNADLNEFKTQIESFIQPQVLSTANRDTSILTYVGEEGSRCIAHIVNSDYDNITTDIEPQSPFNLSIEIPQNFSLEGKKAYLISPDTPEVVELNYAVENGYLSFEIPEVYIYSILIITDPILFESSRTLHQANLWARDAKFDDVYISDIDETLRSALTAYNEGKYQEAKDLSLQVINDIQNRISLRDVTWSTIIAREQMGLGMKNIKEAFYQGNYELAYSLLITDLNLDGKVNIHDLLIISKAFGSHGPDIPNQGDPASEKWNETADVNKDGWISIKDLFEVAKNYGKTV